MSDIPCASESASEDGDAERFSVSGISTLLDDLYDIGDEQDRVDDELDLVSQELEPTYPSASEHWRGAGPLDLLPTYSDQPPEVQEVILDLARIAVRHQDNEDRLVAEATSSARVDRERREAGSKAENRRMNAVLSFAMFVYVSCFAASVYFFAIGNYVAGLLFLGGPVLIFLGNAITTVVTKPQNPVSR